MCLCLFATSAADPTKAKQEVKQHASEAERAAAQDRGGGTVSFRLTDHTRPQLIITFSINVHLVSSF